MFNNDNKKSNKKSSMDTTNSSGKNLPSVNMISEGTNLEGTLETKNDIRVAGTLNGEAKAKGKVIVSATGKVDGNIVASDADISGKVDGEVRVTNKLVLRKSAKLEGDIYTKTILAEEGAQINGSFHMNENIKDTISKSKSSNASSSKSSKNNSNNGNISNKGIRNYKEKQKKEG